MTVVLLSCSATKLSHPAPARELYRGSIFRKSLALAYRRYGLGVEIAVLSAKYGLVGIDEMIEPYNLNLLTAPMAFVTEWATRTRPMVVARYPSAHFIGLVPHRYALALEGLDVELPMEGMRNGKRLRWLTEALST